MLDIPFPLQTVPVKHADAALEELIAERTDVTPVLLGDRDVFSTEWAEYVDVFENPHRILAEARAIDTDLWFASRRQKREARKVELGRSNLLSVAARSSVDLALWPLRKVGLVSNKSAVSSKIKQLPPLVRTLKAQLAELEATGEATDDDLNEFRDVITELELDGTETLYPDPVDYVTPRHGNMLAAGMVRTSEPWESAAWLQHGAYGSVVPMPIFVAHCRWLWNTHSARLITASTDHVGFQMERPVKTQIEAVEVMRRFELLGATELNGDRTGGDGKSLLNADRLWVWWD